MSLGAPMPSQEERLTRARLESFKGLKPNWDSYNAPAIDHATVDRAIRLMELLNWPPILCAPTSNGGVAFMDLADKELFISLNPGGDMEFEELKEAKP